MLGGASRFATHCFFGDKNGFERMPALYLLPDCKHHHRRCHFHQQQHSSSRNFYQDHRRRIQKHLPNV